VDLGVEGKVIVRKEWKEVGGKKEGHGKGFQRQIPGYRYAYMQDRRDHAGLQSYPH